MQPRIYWVLTSAFVVLAGCNAVSEVSAVGHNSPVTLFHPVTQSPVKIVYKTALVLKEHSIGKNLKVRNLDLISAPKEINRVRLVRFA